MWEAFGDLVLGTTCVGCDRPGRLLCDGCAAEVSVAPRPSWPVPPPPGLTAMPWAATTYDGTVRALVLGHKEHHLLSLAAPLGRLLAAAVAAALDPAHGGPAHGGQAHGDPAHGDPPSDESAHAATVVVVPVPSRPAAVRQRGHDPTGALVARAAAELRASGCPARSVPLLRTRPGLADQAGLDAGARAANLDRSMRADGRALRRLARTAGPVRVVVCDDVITTGSTLAEAERALRAVGVRPCAVAAVAATQRRLPPTRGARDS